jgi:hypothetical protein
MEDNIENRDFIYKEYIGDISPDKNENYFWTINSLEDLLVAKNDGFPDYYLSTSEKMPGASMLHQSARICNLELINEYLSGGDYDVNRLDNNNCTSLGYLINIELKDNLIKKIGDVTTIYNGCNDAEQIVEAIRLLQYDNQANCVYFGKKYTNKYIENYIKELQKHYIQIAGFSRYETAKQVCEGDIKFNTLPQELKTDRKFALIVLRKNGMFLRFMDNFFKKDKEIVKVAVSKYFGNIEYADESLKNDKEIILSGTLSDINYFIGLDVSLKKDRDITLKALNDNGFAINHIDDSFKSDYEIGFTALDWDIKIFQLLDDSLKKDNNFIIEYIKRKHTQLWRHINIAKFFDVSQKKDEKLVFEAINLSGINLEFVDKSFRKNEKMVLVAIASNYESIQFADKSLKENRDFILKAVEINGFVLSRVPISFQKDRQIVLAAVKSRPEVFKYVYEDFKQDKEIKKLSRNGLRY